MGMTWTNLTPDELCELMCGDIDNDDQAPEENEQIKRKAAQYGKQ